ncbi:hypothetical protein ILUMI_24155 [Ignelater luminosus]|uniref:Uncharacterized protein n=1 Tax=Ignelater luminosus TaxID=2038154 RepID=A0A8K0CD43_IGNLU|nr:hypothetical protein ILUMI_24155 [Ignelater luminosus]
MLPFLHDGILLVEEIERYYSISGALQYTKLFNSCKLQEAKGIQEFRDLLKRKGHRGCRKANCEEACENVDQLAALKDLDDEDLAQFSGETDQEPRDDEPQGAQSDESLHQPGPSSKRQRLH